MQPDLPFVIYFRLHRQHLLKVSKFKYFSSEHPIKYAGDSQQQRGDWTVSEHFPVLLYKKFLIFLYKPIFFHFIISAQSEANKVHKQVLKSQCLSMRWHMLSQVQAFGNSYPLPTDQLPTSPTQHCKGIYIALQLSKFRLPLQFSKSSCETLRKPCLAAA